jgi:hypothetical protein
MVSGAALSETIGPSVLPDLQFVPKNRRSFAPTGSCKAQELAGHKISRMSGYEVEETGFVWGVAEGLERVDLDLWEIHSDKMAAVISC